MPRVASAVSLSAVSAGAPSAMRLPRMNSASGNSASSDAVSRRLVSEPLRPGSSHTATATTIPQSGTSIAAGLLAIAKAIPAAARTAAAMMPDPLDLDTVASTGAPVPGRRPRIR